MDSCVVWSEDEARKIRQTSIICKGGILMGGPGATGGGFWNDNFAFVLFLILILLVLSDD